MERRGHPRISARSGSAPKSKKNSVVTTSRMSSGCSRVRACALQSGGRRTFRRKFATGAPHTTHAHSCEHVVTSPRVISRRQKKHLTSSRGWLIAQAPSAPARALDRRRRAGASSSSGADGREAVTTSLIIDWCLPLSMWRGPRREGWPSHHPCIRAAAARGRRRRRLGGREEPLRQLASRSAPTIARIFSRARTTKRRPAPAPSTPIVTADRHDEQTPRAAICPHDAQ